MRTLDVAFACVALCGVAGFSSATKADSTMVKYNIYVGYDYWVRADTLPLCDKPAIASCHQSLALGTHVKVDGLVPQSGDGPISSGNAPYLHVLLDDGRSGFMDARDWSIITTSVDPGATAAAAAECKKKGNPKLGMNAKQVVATCWGPPAYVNTKIRATGKYEQYVYGDNKFVYLRNGVVTSVSAKGRPLGAI